MAQPNSLFFAERDLVSRLQIFSLPPQMDAINVNNCFSGAAQPIQSAQVFRPDGSAGRQAWTFSASTLPETRSPPSSDRKQSKTVEKVPLSRLCPMSQHPNEASVRGTVPPNARA